MGQKKNGGKSERLSDMLHLSFSATALKLVVEKY